MLSRAEAQMKNSANVNGCGLAAKLDIAQQTRSPKLNRCSLALYCVAVVVAFMVWVAGTAGLGPIDDHHFIRTIFLGKEFGSYVMPELGRFFPLTAQEYVLAAKLFGPSAQMFYLINAFKIVLCGGLLFFCLALTGLGNFALAILWTTVMFSMGIANTLFRLSAGELNVLILMLLFAWCIMMLHDQQSPVISGRAGYAILGFSAFFLALFYKELVFVFGLIFALSEFARAYWAKSSRPSSFVKATLLVSALYIVFYGIWRYIYVTGSYADFHATSLWSVLLRFAASDLLIIFVVLPVTAYRVIAILRSPGQYSIYDSFLFAASAYACAFMFLGMFSPYYLLPAYAFAACGLAGILAEYLHKVAQRVILVVVLLFGINIFPMALSDIQTQKLIAQNHFAFVSFLPGWLQANSDTERRSRTIVLVGVSPGSGVEILVSLKTFLVSLGAPESSFEVKATEPSDNKTISDFHGFKEGLGYRPEVNDLLIFNPYQQMVVRPPLQAPSYKEIYRSASEWALPRWMVWHWIELCLMHRAECAARVSDNMRYAGYAAMLVTRGAVPITEALPLETPAYRLGAVNVPARMKSGTTRKLDVLVQNTGTETWPADGILRPGMFVNLAYRWFDQNNQMVLEGDRAPFPEPMQPNDLAKVSIILKVPMLPGKYKLTIGPVQEGVSWFAGIDEKEIEVY